jgi:putative tricarboxylic transport membrane protein
MHEDNDAEADGPSVASNRTLELIVAVLLLGFSAIVIHDSNRIGFGWAADGPQPGYFPFYVALALAGASCINLIRAAFSMDASHRDSFVSAPAALRVLAVLVPTAIYVAAIGYLGIYLSSALFISAFMVFFGRAALWHAALVGGGVALALFMMFERWFLVPLPKGPLEAMLGY